MSTLAAAAGHKDTGRILTAKVLEKYCCEDTRFLPDLDCSGLLLRHRKSGARVMLLPCSDENRAFYIGFRTPPQDSTGCPHIMEHSVLCGSRDFPVKDPFVELAKGSLNTFLNAMTYPDKTLYPVASCNRKDFENLMHVYLDAVFYPDVLQDPNIFRQEGWRYEPEDGADGTVGSVTLNGVVYNEMKGALSSGEDVLEREIQASLFPGSAYAFESGGDPAEIPSLTYDAFCTFHRKYYHPANSYIYLYGDLDMEERLLYMDEAYLSGFDAADGFRAEISSGPVREMNRREAVYSILEEEEEAGRYFMADCFALHGTGRDIREHMTMRVLDHVLVDAEGAPLKEAVRKAGLAEEVYSVYDSSAECPTYSLICRYCDGDAAGPFEKLIDGVLTEQVRSGIDREALLAALSYFEFRYREADFGSYPRGLVYGIEAMDTWLYDDSDPWSRLDAGCVYAELREKIGTGYYEEMLSRMILENRHRSLDVVKPVRGLSAKKDAELADRLDSFWSRMDQDGRDRILADADAFVNWQETPDPPEALAAIPTLSIGDIEKHGRDPVNEVQERGSMTVVAHPCFTGGIDYISLLFDAGSLPERFYPVLGILKTALMAMDTDTYSYHRLDQQVHIHTGGMNVCTGVYEDPSREGGYRYTFELSARCFHSELDSTLDLAEEILLHTDFSDHARLYEILEEERAGLRQSLSSAGHITAMNRALSYFNPAAAFSEITGGLDGYRYLDGLLHDFEAVKEQLAADLQELCGLLFVKEGLTADITAGSADIPGFADAAERFAGKLSSGRTASALVEDGPAGFVFRDKGKANEALETAGEVQFVCAAGDYRKAGYAFSGALRVLRVILGYDYLWNMVRVRGGAYGCMSSFGRDGTAFMVSYRDPNLLKTLEAFRGTPEYLEHFTADPQEMTRYIIGTVSGMDQPMTPKQFGRFSLNCLITGITAEMLQKEREEVLGITAAGIRTLAGLVRAVLAEGYLCTVGSREAIEEAGAEAAASGQSLFGSVMKLF